MAVLPDRFPDYRQVLELATPAGTNSRMIVDRVRLLEFVSASPDASVVLSSAADQIIVHRIGTPEFERLAAVCSGPPAEVAFAGELFAAALQSSIGPDVLIDYSAGHAAVVRSADQGSFTTLVMPQKPSGQGHGPSESVTETSTTRPDRA